MGTEQQQSSSEMPLVDDYSAEAIDDVLPEQDTLPEQEELPEQEDLPEQDALVAQATAGSHLTGSAHVQNLGWIAGTETAEDSYMLGTSGKGLRLEAFTLVADGIDDGSVGSIQCKAHVQNEGWKPWTSTETCAGSTGKGQRLEAIRLRLESESWHVYYRVHVQNVGWLGWAYDGEIAGTAGLGLRLEAMEIKLVPDGAEHPQTGAAYIDRGLSVSAHVQNIGWQAPVSGGSVTLGTTGRGLRVEALVIQRPVIDLTGDVVYETHVQNIGWQGQRKSGQESGTTGQGLRIEAIRIALTGELADAYDIWYRSHVQNVGWLAWASNGDSSGTGGMALRMEAVQIALVPKGAGAPAADGQATARPFLSRADANVLYASMANGVAQDGVSNGSVSGITGRALPLEGISAAISGMEGSISYDAYVSGKGWQTGGTNGAWIGAPNVEAIRVCLGGEIARFYDVCYRVHLSNVGWLGWARNAQHAGSTQLGYAVEAWQMVLVPKGAGAPGSTDNHEVDRSFLYSKGQRLADANATQLRIVSAAQTVPSLGGGLCAAWVESVYQQAGLGAFEGDARDLYAQYCHSADLSQLKVGMIIAVSTHPHTYLGSVYGHVCIFVGDGIIRDSYLGYIRQMQLSEWLAHYGATVQPRWGWLGNTNVA